MDMAEDWDLHAVVRGCTTTATTTAASACCSSSSSAALTTTAAPAPTGRSSSFFEPQLDGTFFGLQDLCFEQTVAATELHDLYKPFYTVSPPPPLPLPLSPQNIPISPLSVLGGLQDLAQKTAKEEPQQLQQQHQQVYQPKQSSRSSGAAAPPSHRSKRRKNQLKKVCQVPAEALSSDSWSWRKYGQKPIKGSPYPRGYYRCSTSKGCMARKQVERNRSDPGMFIVTYTSEHNHPMPTHRNSLAGSTRNKQATSQPTVSGEPRKPSGSPPLSPSASLSSAPGKLEVESSKDEVLGDEDEDDAVNGYEMAVDDEFFTGLEEFAMVGESDLLNMQFPWLSNNATTTTAAAAGGDG